LCEINILDIEVYNILKEKTKWQSLVKKTLGE
jgi:hypothetical protein